MNPFESDAPDTIPAPPPDDEGTREWDEGAWDDETPEPSDSHEDRSASSDLRDCSSAPAEQIPDVPDAICVAPVSGVMFPLIPLSPSREGVVS